MPSKRHIYNFLRDMNFRERLKLSIAVFLIFGTFGPAFSLAQVAYSGSWEALFVRTILSGGLSAGIILFGKFFHRSPWMIAIYIVLFSFAIGKTEKITVAITGRDEMLIGEISQPIQISPEQFESYKNRRMAIYAMTTMMVGLGWAMFSWIITSDGRKRVRLQTEMQLAAEIQASLLPSSTLRTSWCEVAGRTIPAAEVGGDYFDVVEIARDIICVAVADVAGHGVGAGILSAMTKSALRTQIQHDPDPASLLTALNATIFELSDLKTFVTFGYVLMDRKKGIARIATAGHPPILRYRTGSECEKIRTPNLALGVKLGVKFREKKVTLRKGDVFVLYTDGVTEAGDKSGNQFGEDRLDQALKQSLQEQPLDICTKTANEIKVFSHSEQFQDDVTLVAVKIL